MKTLLFTHTDCLYHDTGAGHPERPDRLRAVLHALYGDGFESLERRDAPKATEEQLARVHRTDYVESIFQNVPEVGLVHLDGDTLISPGSGDASLRAAGAVCAAVDAVLGGEAQNAFCAVRPPGHHAEPSRAMGFCLFNNVAVGAFQARAAHPIERVAVIDFDVHHGNGTQAMFEKEPDLLYASSHQWPLYPGTGHSSERGVGNILNICLPPASGSRAFRDAVSKELMPMLDRFQPELVMISAGFDAHQADPLANLNFTDDDYAWVTDRLAEIAGRHCQGRIVSTLEGGYNLQALGSASAAHVKSLIAAGGDGRPDPDQE